MIMENMNLEQLMQLLKEQAAELAALKEVRVVETVSDKTPKNQKPGKADNSKKYVLLSRSLDTWGKVPQQQKDLAAILSHAMEVGKEYTEGEVFAILNEYAADYTSLRTSKQDVTYLFRYYRSYNLKDGKHLGFVGREFLQVK